jgi:hypothetical protein
MISPVSTTIGEISQNACALASPPPTPLRAPGDATSPIVEPGHAVAVRPRLAGHPASRIVKDRLGDRRPEGNY